MKEYKRWLPKVCVTVMDFLVFEASLCLAYYFWIKYPWHGNWQYFSEFSIVLWFLPPVAILIFHFVGLYKPEMGVLSVDEQSLIFKAIWIIYFIVFASGFFSRTVTVSRLAMLYSMFISLVLISVERFFARQLARWLYFHGYANQKAVIYGAGFHGVRLERWIRQSPQLGIQVVGYLDDHPQKLEKLPKVPPVLGKLSDLQMAAANHHVSTLFVSQQNLQEEQIVEIIQYCRQLKVRCWVIPSLYRFYIEHVELHNIGGIPLLGFRQETVKRYYEIFKSVLDRVSALILIVILAPLWGAIAAGVSISLGAPVLFRQTRVGQHGKRFTIYKFRTLKRGIRQDQISPELQQQKKPKDRSFVSFLRHSGLDEIPQLLNVLAGDMSMIGPRPEMPFLAEKYGPLERERLSVKPGITGLWQISEDRKRFLIHENMDYDLYYIDHFGFNLDLAILVKTVFVVLKRFFRVA
ncbi:MAG: hypothetical protein A2Z83_01290 [Omnitrophica bacterium GWA2_52_8]|nr:MAG: hypothetical protein A2Z83_01290 [Omnitrophica bacterium GWA2_52_8]